MNTFNLFLAILVTLVAVEGQYTGPTNQAGINLIKDFEGLRLNFYRDAVNVITIGYGHACHANNCAVPINGKYSVPLTLQSAESLLQDDLSARYESCVRNSVTYRSLNSNQFSALVSFAFNVGCGNLRQSTLLRKLNAGDVSGAANEFRRWVKAGGRTLRGLVRRRAAERALFCSGNVC